MREEDDSDQWERKITVTNERGNWKWLRRKERFSDKWERYVKNKSLNEVWRGKAGKGPKGRGKEDKIVCGGAIMLICPWRQWVTCLLDPQGAEGQGQEEQQGAAHRAGKLPTQVPGLQPVQDQRGELTPSLYHSLTLSPSQPLTLSPTRHLTLSPSHLLTLSPSNTVTLHYRLVRPFWNTPTPL